MTKERLEFRADKRISDAIHSVAESEGVSVSQVIRTLVREGMVQVFSDPAENLEKINEEIDEVEENLRNLKKQRKRLQESISEEADSIEWKNP